jgi:methionyl-tRNA synthetase
MTERQGSHETAASNSAEGTGGTPPSGRASDLVPQMIDIDTFRQVDLRVAEIVAAEPIAGATRLLRLQVELGFERRQLVAGIAEWYTPEQLVGRKIVVAVNLAPARLRGVESQGMLLAAGGREPGAALGLLSVDAEIPNGTRVE